MELFVSIHLVYLFYFLIISGVHDVYHAAVGADVRMSEPTYFLRRVSEDAHTGYLLHWIPIRSKWHGWHHADDGTNDEDQLDNGDHGVLTLVSVSLIFVSVEQFDY